MYKVVCFDLDGTLLTTNKKIGQDEILMINRLKENNINIVLVSGRHIDEILPFVEVLSLTDNDYLISCDGQYIHNRYGEVVWSNLFLSKKDLFFIGVIMKRSFVFFAKNKDYVITPRGNFVKNTISKKERITWCKLLFSQIDCIEKIKLKNILVKGFLKKIYTIHEYSNNVIEVLNKNVNKYNALCKLNEKFYNIKWAEFLYFGDDMNDIECFEHIPNCVAMHTAPDAIKSKASYITSSCDDSGVFLALKEIFGM